MYNRAKGVAYWVQACAGLVRSGVFRVAGVSIFGGGRDLMNKPLR